MINTLVRILVLATSLLFLPILANASCNYEDFEGWKDCFVKEKLSQRMNSVDVATFRSAQYVPKVIDLDKKQPEKKLTLKEYQKLIDINGKIARGKAFYKDNQELVENVADEYKVNPEVIVALIGLESDYGKNQGNYNIIDSLATLSYEGRRKSFFEKELLNALTIAKNEKFKYENFQGSWAGAMGQCQFMPSSYLSYAVDYDNDGVKDIWNSKPDAVASAANYLVKNGWQMGHSSISRIYKLDKNYAQNCKNKDICNYKDNLNLIFVRNNDIVTDTFAVGKNYKVLMKWNRSNFFVLSILTIADKIKMEG